MSKNTTVSITLKLRGTAGKDLSRITTEQINQTQKINANWNMATTAQAKFTDQLRRSTTETKQASGASDQLLRTNRMLEGVLRQQAIQTRLLSGQLKAQNRDYSLQTRMLSEQARHAKDLQRAMADAARNQRDMSRNQPKTGTGGMGGMVGGIASGAAAAYAMVRTPLERARSFETKIFDATSSITGGYYQMNPQQAKSENLKLNTYAKNAVMNGHGSVDGVADATGILASSGLYRTTESLEKPLLAIAKTAFSAGSTETDIAELTRSIKLFGLSDTQQALDRSLQSGFGGGFELKDMARLLPEVLPFASKAGYQGEDGYDRVLTHMQLARRYTGIPSEAATNMKDLYGYLSSPVFARHIGQYITPEEGDPIKKIGLRGNRKGLDAVKYLARAREKGENTVDTSIGLMNRQLSKNPEYVRLAAELKTMEDQQQRTGKPVEGLGDKKAALEIVVAGLFGKIFTNHQSLQGITAQVVSKQNGSEEQLLDELRTKGNGASQRVYDIKEKIEPAQAHTLEQQSILATIRMYDTVKERLGDFEQGLADTMKANQALTAAAYAAAGALAVLAAAKIGGGLLGGGIGGAAAGGVLTKLGGYGAMFGAGYVGGTMLRDWYTTTDVGQKFDNGIGEGLANVFAMFGSDTAQQALETQAAYEASIEKQTRELKDALQALRPMSRHTPATPADLLSGLSQSVTQESRRGVPYRP
jgi:hypothetical protein